MSIRGIRDCIKTEVNSWMTNSSEQNEKRIFPHFATLNTKTLIKYSLISLIFFFFINITCLFFQGFYNLLVQVPSLLKHTENLIPTIFALLLIAMILLIITAFSLFISILCYDKNVTKNEKLTKVIFISLLAQALTNSKLFELAGVSKFISLLS